VETREETLQALSSRALIISLIIATIFSYLMAQWVKIGELYSYSTQISESVPPIPSVWALVFLVALNPVLRKVSRRLALSRGQILVIYTFTMVSVAMASAGAVRTFFPFITGLQYYSGSNPDYQTFLKYLDPRFFPKDQGVIQAAYEGAANERVPWDAWAGPIMLWSLFFLVLFFTMLCLLTIFRRQWAERERLTFPLVQFALEMTEEGSQKRGSATFFRNPWMWVGFFAAALFTVTNILAAFDPSVPHMGRDFAVVLSERPWSALSDRLAYRPTVFGLAYLVPLDVSLSVWVTYFMIKLEGVLALMLGRTTSGLTFSQEQSLGAFAALLLSSVWIARSHLKDVLERALGRGRWVDDSGEVMPYRLAVFGSLAGFAFLVGFAATMGVGVLTSSLLFIIVLGTGVVYSKLRAEAGTPLLWTIPFNVQKEALIYTVGSKRFSTQSLTVLSIFRFLTRGYFMSTSAYQVDGMKMAPAGKVRQRQMGGVLLMAIVVGLATSFWIHLGAYYKYGANVLETQDPSTGGYRMYLATSEFNQLASMANSPTSTDWNRTGWTAAGFVFATGLTMLRKSFFGFPLHPMGFALAASFGGTLWGAFLLAWLVKFVILRVGGLRLYERLTPGALGIVFGEFFTAGAWSFMGLINPDWGRSWMIFFG